MKLARLRLLGHIDRYVGSLFVASYATALLLVVGLAFIMDLANDLEFFETWEDGSRAPASAIVRYYLLSLPFVYLQVAPFVTVTAGLFTATRLVKNDEVVAALNAGVSAQRVFLMAVLGSFVAAFAMFFLREACTEAFSYRRDALHDMLDEHRNERVIEELWLREGFSAIRLGEFRPSTGGPEPFAEIRDLLVLQREGQVYTEQVASRAVWVSGQEGPFWLLEDGELRREQPGHEPFARRISEIEGVAFTPQDALLSWRGRENPMELSFSETLALVTHDPDNVQLQTLLQYHLTFPLANVVLLLVALPFLLTHRRGAGGEGLTAGILLCVFYFCTDFTTRSLGMEGACSPMVAAWLPILLFGSLGAALYEGMST